MTENGNHTRPENDHETFFKYEGKRYRYQKPDETGFCSIVNFEGVSNQHLYERFCDFEQAEEKAHEFGYWWESQISLAKRAMEKEGAKILEFEDEEVEMADKDGRPIVF